MIDVTDFPTPQEAFDAVTGEGDTVYFPAGVYEVTTGLLPKSGTRIVGDGYGSVIKCPDVGFPRTSNLDAGILNLHDPNGTVEHIQIQNIRIFGTKTQDNDLTPKLIYMRDANDVELSSSWLENTSYEGFFQEGVGGFDHRVTNNHVNDVGFPAGLFVGLPAIQMNGRRGVVSDNILTDVGIGIGATGGKTIVANNVIENPTNIGIQIGDNGPGEGIVIANNSITIFGSTDQAIVGIFAGAGQEAFEQVITGNSILMEGQLGDQPPRGIYSGTSEYVAIKNNSLDIMGVGQGIRVEGASNGTLAYYSSNTVKMHDLVAPSAALVAATFGADRQLFLYSSDNVIYYDGSNLDTYAIDYNNQSGGTLTTFILGDIVENGFVRINGNQKIGPVNRPLYSFLVQQTN